MRIHLLAYACRIYVAAFRARTGLCIYWPAYPAAPPLSASCSSGQRFAFSFLRIPPRGGHPCCSANTSPCRVCRGLSPPSERALPGAPKKRGSVFAAPGSFFICDRRNHSGCRAHSTALSLLPASKTCKVTTHPTHSVFFTFGFAQSQEKILARCVMVSAEIPRSSLPVR
jgi:hypothetical protein